jgi:zinc/manganese transport system substrate-binding protein
MRVLLVAAALLASLASLRAEPLPVVATFSILGDMVRAVGGDRVSVVTLVGPDGDAHVYQPSPRDARALRDARLVVANGLGFEGWIDRLVAASGYAGPVVIASRGVTPLVFPAGDGRDTGDERPAHGAHAAGEHAHDAGEHDGATVGDGDGDGDGAIHAHGAVDPHAWQSLPNARLYVANIATALAAADPAGAADYAANRDRYLAAIAALEADLAARLARIPEDQRTVVTSHDAFGYFAAMTGIRFVAPVGVSTDAEVSAKDVAAIVRQIRAEGIRAVFVENVSDPRLLDRIAAETGATVGGTLYSDALSGPGGDAPTYLDMMRHNIVALTAALGA